MEGKSQRWSVILIIVYQGYMLPTWFITEDVNLDDPTNSVCQVGNGLIFNQLFFSIQRSNRTEVWGMWSEVNTCKFLFWPYQLPVELHPSTSHLYSAGFRIIKRKKETYWVLLYFINFMFSLCMFIPLLSVRVSSERKMCNLRRI